ncbi:MAG: GH92 family glycosyl hydrolase [Prolixibacteraceae bacterium]|nr:GH92 family glycosyl hydrolase [Prolixibacteraceae bacterium]
MRLQLFKYIIPLFFVFGCSDKEPVDYVDPFIGTGFHGHTYPGATTPFGAVQLSPDSRRGNWDACSGYHYSDSTLLGFSHTHLSGTGCIDLGDILFHPTISEIQKKSEGYLFEPLSFSHKNEVAKAGYYRVNLNNGIRAELTATTHVGVHRYTFPKEGQSKIIIDLAHLLENETINEAEIQINAGEIAGMRRTSGWVANQHIYFVAQFSQPFDAEIISSGKSVPDEKVKGNNLQAVVLFPESNGKSVVCKVGLSLVSVDNARLNLQSETVDFNFDRIKSEAESVWNKTLSVYKVSGGKPEEMTNFYTALYHTMVAPNVTSDVNGEYRGGDQQIHQSGNRKVYSTMSLWDTFRAWNPLMTLTDTTLVNDMVNSFLDFYDQTGELPVWPLSSGETGTMIGYHSVSVIYDAYSKNIRGFDAEKAFEAMKVSANKNKKGTAPFLDLGFIPADSKRESVSCLLENVYDDWCIAQMAKALGYEDDFNFYLHRSEFYKNVFDGQSRFFRSRLQDGIWETPFNPYEVSRAFTEATAWQYRFFVPHDVKGMINLFGGNQHFTEALDSLFNTALTTLGHLSDITGLIGQYAHGNEPSHHMAYLYSFAGQPWKTQEMVRRLLTEMYQPTPEGISGNEDCGQMSAWYVLSSLGLYPVCPGSNQFILSAPIFEKVDIRLANGKILQITANDPAKNSYVAEVFWNGKPLQENFVTYSQLMEGGILKFVLDNKPNTSRGIAPETFPYSLSETSEVSVPYISNDISFFAAEVEVHCGTATEGAEIRYTLDGSEPSENSLLYEKPFILNNTATIKLKAFKSGFTPSAVSTYQASKVVYKPAISMNLTNQGVHYQYFEGRFSKVSEIKEKGKLIDSGSCELPNLSIARNADHYGIIFDGFIYTPVEGIYTFSTRSDDGSLFKIGNQTVVNNDGSHADIRAVGRIALKKGFHPYELLYFEDYEGEALSLNWIVPDSREEEQISANHYFVK